MITLSADERKKFAAWCMQECETNRGISDQIQQLEISSELIKELAIDAKAQQMRACTIVAGLLDSR